MRYHADFMRLRLLLAALLTLAAAACGQRGPLYLRDNPPPGIKPPPPPAYKPVPYPDDARTDRREEQR
jgi:predicted small lipoprotein YifL